MKLATDTGCAVVIVAAGRGSRAISPKNGSAPQQPFAAQQVVTQPIATQQVAKQYQKLDHRTMLAHTLDAFIKHPKVSQIQVVIHADDETEYQTTLAEITKRDKLLPSVTGGVDRQRSVLNGLEALIAEGFLPNAPVLIHDAARPFISSEIIHEITAKIKPKQGAIPTVPIVDTIKRGADGAILETVSRVGLYGAQTPQGFILSDILAAHKAAHDQGITGFTDDADIAQWAEIKVTMVEGSRDNFKITTGEDLTLAREKLNQNLPDIRTGQGYDSHIFDESSDLYLCGVKIDHSHGLKGHSDADVGLHALTDALLGTIASGDIGSHFPPSDPQWKGANSQQFLTHAVELIKDDGGIINHVDVTLICEMPKIGPHRDKMRAKMAELLEIEVSRVSLKATTNEQMGFIGRGEGMAAMATATVIFGTN